MENLLKKAVETNTVDFLKSTLIIPLLKNFESNYDERCYRIFTKDLADIFEEYQPNYFSDDYSSRVGQYFFSSLYDDYVPEEMLIEIIKADEHENFEAVKIYFEDFDSMTTYVVDMLRDDYVRLDFMDELFTLEVLKNLNTK